MSDKWDALREASPVLQWVIGRSNHHFPTTVHHLKPGIYEIHAGEFRRGQLLEIITRRHREAKFNEKLDAIMHSYPGTNRQDAINLCNMWSK